MTLVRLEILKLLHPARSRSQTASKSSCPLAGGITISLSCLGGRNSCSRVQIIRLVVPSVLVNSTAMCPALARALTCFFVNVFVILLIYSAYNPLSSLIVWLVREDSNLRCRHQRMRALVEMPGLEPGTSVLSIQRSTN